VTISQAKSYRATEDIVLQVLEKNHYSVCRKAAGPDQVSAANVVFARLLSFLVGLLD